MKKTILLILILVLIQSAQCNAFEIAKNDVWYYESSILGAKTLPDKADHFYRSYFMTQIIDLKKTIALDLLYEIYDGYRCVGFSKKDLLVDVLGAIAGKMHGKKIMSLIKWNSAEKNIILTLYLRF